MFLAVARVKDTRDILTGELREAVKEADEATQQRVAIESLGKELDALASEERAVFPEPPGLGIQMRCHMREIRIDVIRMLGDAEEFEEGFVIRQPLHRGELQPRQRDMGRIEINRDDCRRIRAQVVHDVATAGGDRHDPAVRCELQGFKIDNGIFPDLVVDEAGKPHRKQTLEKRLAPR